MRAVMADDRKRRHQDASDEGKSKFRQKRGVEDRRYNHAAIQRDFEDKQRQRPEQMPGDEGRQIQVCPPVIGDGDSHKPPLVCAIIWSFNSILTPLSIPAAISRSLIRLNNSPCSWLAGGGSSPVRTAPCSAVFQPWARLVRRRHARNDVVALVVPLRPCRPPAFAAAAKSRQVCHPGAF